MKKLWFLPLLMMVGCTTLTTDHHSNDKNDIELSFYNYLSTKNNSSYVGAYCVGYKDGQNVTNPRQEILKKLTQFNPNIVPVSECTVANDVRLKNDNSKATLLFINTLNCDDKQQCTIQGGYYLGNLGSQASTYKAVKVDQKWFFTVADQGPVS
ncbi:hypothetical protein KTI63_07165 [Acinetobacter guillouiae]|uniref:hypothetical protein n=1 Tax=Acinetobacter guillouiae TaxID=106649 RepID=UPI0021D32F58|nr:hypothetical protein [Acinetobacter guillouiae]MCU4492253.1 hypothetical protein [Acinetobacter guillouiae]